MKWYAFAHRCHIFCNSKKRMNTLTVGGSVCVTNFHEFASKLNPSVFPSHSIRRKPLIVIGDLLVLKCGGSSFSLARKRVEPPLLPPAVASSLSTSMCLHTIDKYASVLRLKTEHESESFASGIPFSARAIHFHIFKRIMSRLHTTYVAHVPLLHCRRMYAQTLPRGNDLLNSLPLKTILWYLLIVNEEMNIFPFLWFNQFTDSMRYYSICALAFRINVNRRISIVNVCLWHANGAICSLWCFTLKLPTGNLSL